MAHERVLIVEDEGVIAFHIQRLLTGFGYTVVGATGSGEEAVRLAVQSRPDVVLMDIRLWGDMTGIEAARQIRAQFDTPVIYLTAYAEDDVLQQAASTEPYGYLVKPVQERELRATIEMALYKHHLNQKLRESEERYRALSELMSDYAYAFRVEPDGALVREWTTEAFTRITGLTPEEADARGGWPALIFPDDRDGAQRRGQRLLAGQVDVSEFRIVTRGGQVRWLRDYGRPIWDAGQGRVVRILGAAQDITERKRAEDALREGEERYRDLVENQGEGIGILDTSGRFVFANPAGETIFGVPPGELVGRSLAEFTDPEQFAVIQEQIRRRHKRDRSTFEYEIIRPDGERRAILLTATPQFDPAGNLSGSFGIFRDITQRKRAEESAARLYRDLEHRNQELAALNRANQAIASTLDLDAVLRIVINEIRKLVDAEAASVLLPEDATLVFAASAGPAADDLVGTRMPIGAGIAGSVLRDGQPMLVEDARSDRHFYNQVDTVTGLTTRSLLAVPLMVKGKAQGVIEAINKVSRAFDMRDLELLESVASAAAIALENARLFAAVEKELVERERAELDLRASEERFRLMAENAQDLIYRYRFQPMPGFEYVSPSSTALVGYTPEEHYADPDLGNKLVHPNDRSLWEVVLQSPTMFNQPLVLRWLRKDGAVIWVEQRNVPILDEDGTLIALEGVARDITERKRAEEELRRRNQALMALNAIATTIGQALGLEQILTATLDKLLNVMQVDGGWVQLIEPDGQTLVLAAERGMPPRLADKLRKGQVGQGSLGQVAASGQPYIAASAMQEASLSPQVQVAPAFTLAGAPIRSKDRTLGVLGIGSHVLRALSQPEVQLLIAIGHQLGIAIENARLAQQAAEVEILREVDRMRSELIANVSHELRTPLGLIKISATSLLMDDVQFDQDTQRRFLQNIDEETVKLEKIVENLLDLGRMEGGRLRLERQPIEMGRLTHHVVQVMQTQSVRHRLVSRFPAEPLTAVVDARRIEQVLRNLLDNAIKYSPRGGTITVLGYREQQQIVLQVSDEGIGIPIDERDKIFERFYRVDNQVTRTMRGAGLGLAVCRGIVEAHGGHIWVESRPGAGSVFCFALPAHSRDHSAEEEAQ